MAPTRDRQAAQPTLGTEPRNSRLHPPGPAGLWPTPNPETFPATVRQGQARGTTGAREGGVRGTAGAHGHGAPHVGAAALPIAHQAPGRPHRAGPLHRAAQQRSPSRTRRPIKVEQGYAPPANHHRGLDASPRAYQASEHPRPPATCSRSRPPSLPRPTTPTTAPPRGQAAHRHRGHGRTARSSPSLIVGECAIMVRRRAGHLLPRPVAVRTGGATAQRFPDASGPRRGTSRRCDTNLWHTLV